ncbi:hypothetical protein LUZ63_001149 [Rhynchospora breviuscula]|uniref:Heat shock protein 70 n=1 Tax=Rhynchospora breviuscula TaxID=2022672 RepID=A0A9Q0HXA7_9POAL|nr:hypothetical protein LUZ63_001149 [Rhynchospora breviuscula]
MVPTLKIFLDPPLYTDLIEKCLSDAKIDKTGFDVVVLVGGSTRIPNVQQLLQDFFEGKELCKGINPDEAVACGAAIQAVNLTGYSNKDMQNLVLVDVTPLSLGVGINKGCEEMLVVVPRNKMQEVFITGNDHQTRAILPIYEGESADTKNNNLLGEFVLEGIDPAPMGLYKIDVYFDVDANGILTVSAQDRSTGHSSL